MNYIKYVLAVFLYFVFIIGYAHNKQIAITIDDWPFSPKGMALCDNIQNALLKHKAPAVGFVIAEKLTPETLPQLESLKAHGFSIGSHAYSHISLRKVSVEDFMEDIARADVVLSTIMTKPKYFRYPYLAEGRWWWDRNKVHDYLKAHDYVIAPVNLDSRDFLFNTEFVKTHNEEEKLKIKKQYLDFVWSNTKKAASTNKKLILLLHANVLNSYYMDDLLTMFESHGYQFISLAQALS